MGTLLQTVENGHLTKLQAPTDVNYEVTPVCNFCCEFCYMEGEEKLEHPPLNHVRNLLHAIKESGVFGITLMGREFFIYPSWREVLEEVEKLGFFTGFVSNGTGLNKFANAKWVAPFVRMRGGAISLHGAKPQTHNAITRHPKAWDIATKAIENCLNAGIQTTILMTPLPNNMNQVYPLGQLAHERGWNVTIIVGRLIPEGRARCPEYWESKHLTIEQFHTIFAAAHRASLEFGLTYMVGDSIPFCLIPEEHRYLAMACSTGSSFAGISHDGSLRTCSTSSFVLGNILKTPLRELWTKHPVLQQFRTLEWLPARCHRCSLLESCRGGCSLSSCKKVGAFGIDGFL